MFSNPIIAGLIAGITSGAVISTLAGFMLHQRTVTIEENIRHFFQQSIEVFKSKRDWKEQSVAELLGPVFIHLDRSKRAFDRWKNKNFYIEAKVIGESNLKIRNLLLDKPHLIPPELLTDAAKLIEHYDRWLEEFEKVRASSKPDLDTPFVFVGPSGYPFPRESELRFKETFMQYWKDLYQSDG